MFVQQIIANQVMIIHDTLPVIIMHTHVQKQFYLTVMHNILRIYSNTVDDFRLSLVEWFAEEKCCNNPSSTAVGIERKSVSINGETASHERTPHAFVHQQQTRVSVCVL